MKPAAESWDTFATAVAAGMRSNNQKKKGDVKALSYNVS